MSSTKPTFWFVAVNSLLILRNLRAKKRATDPLNVPNVRKFENLDRLRNRIRRIPLAETAMTVMSPALMARMSV